ncbi:uncharacterized protein LOC127844255 isoform X1 [Dreissena polymorpha]|uniref:Uncharacterized protein n=1 Tax=Dreissena polymorpha TaxID=45954 RepID=A0A9D4IK52_DREPO|nr:uncharacterized protein LOC127844255 isoform X1 [Dreissena polymorpha]KAH3775597.1 hypothetical protein DPMN_177003 [Dreissena polymorpha]
MVAVKNFIVTSVEGMSLYTLFATCYMVGIVISGPAQDISSLRILGCSCSTCNVEQIGYAIHGIIRATFNGGEVRCSREPIEGFGRIVVGWNLACDLPNTSGPFEISYVGAAHQLCGISFDRVSLSNCSVFGVPCSSIG